MIFFQCSRNFSNDKNGYPCRIFNLSKAILNKKTNNVNSNINEVQFQNENDFNGMGIEPKYSNNMLVNNDINQYLNLNNQDQANQPNMEIACNNNSLVLPYKYNDNLSYEFYNSGLIGKTELEIKSNSNSNGYLFL